MTYAEFIKELDRASLTVRSFAELVRMHRNSVSNYAKNGEVPAHLGLIAAFIAELHAHGIDYRPAIKRASPSSKKTRGRARPGHFGGDPQEQLELD